MKTLFLSLSLLIICFTGYTQQRTLAKFTVQTAFKNHNDYTKWYVSNNSYFVFYITADKKFYFGSVVNGQNQQSYGYVTDLEGSETPETGKEYGHSDYSFNWHYSNSYDNQVGVAAVKLVKVDKPGGVGFTLKIIPENLDLLEYTGVMQGSLKLD